MDKRYQVFISSTYADLQEERSQVIQTVMEMDCIPAGMELFPAMDEEQFNFIKRVIDDCDYYLLIVGGRYGSLANDGISYTEKEYDYAVERGIKIIALLHEDPDEIPVAKSDISPDLRDRLLDFRNKVSENRLVKFWNKADELPGLVALSLSKTIKTYPATGWIRAHRAPSDDILSEINELRKENQDLKVELNKIRESQKPQIENIASLDETFELTLEYSTSVSTGGRYRTKKHTKQIQVSWATVFSLISPHLLSHPNDGSVNSTLGSALYQHVTGEKKSARVRDQDFQTIKIQLSALNLTRTQYSQTVGGGMALFWSLTSKGHELMLRLRSIKSEA